MDKNELLMKQLKKDSQVYQMVKTDNDDRKLDLLRKKKDNRKGVQKQKEWKMYFQNMTLKQKLAMYKQDDYDDDSV